MKRDESQSEDDFEPSDGDEDDLETFDEEATLATAHDERKELYELQLESELPLAELLRQYGISDVPTATENETIQVEETSTTNKESDWALNEGTMLEAERVAYEENVSSCHERLEYNTGLTKPLPRFPEPVTNKCHWLHVLEEMSWLSGDFSRERKWRTRSAFKTAAGAMKHAENKSKSIKKQLKEAVLISQKTAKTIANTVLTFWNKVEKVRSLQDQATQAQQQKMKLDAQLDDLVKLSESYSTELSKRMNINVVQHGGKPLFETNRMPFVSRDSPISNDTNVGKEISGGADVCETTESDLNSPLLRHTLRDYQLNGVRWLRNCFLNNLNVLLADEMGLGKTIQTIALLSTLATEFGNWGPHLIVVPTSVMLNWEVEFKKWCPALKVFSYFGSVKERRSKRSGWSKPNSFHVCITSYRIVTQDQTIFRRKNWEYLILDEAHMIKNWRSQRWQTLLTFNTKRRLLITGTPLQNDLMELWALMHFLMPALFNSHSEFKDWFANPMIAMIDGTETVNNSLVKRLHSILRPFILRRLKTDVEKSLPKKHEHVLKCPLSRRQRRLYEEYISSDGTLKTLSSGNMVGVMHCLMQLRKVCNHPDLFAGRQICTSFDMRQISWISPSVLSLISSSLRRKFLGEFHFESAHVDALNKIRDDLMLNVQRNYKDRAPQTDDELNLADLILQALRQKRRESNSSSIKHPLECGTRNVKSLIDAWDAHCPVNPAQNKVCYSLIWQVADIETSSLRYTFLIPRVRSNVTYEELCWLDIFRRECAAQWNTRAQQALAPIRKSVARQCLFFPDRCLVQYDCGKLQILASLLRQLKCDGHKALIFTQMTKMLDVLETFLNLHGYTYCRLDGSTNAEQRQLLMQRFNSDDRIFIFILSTRSGGFGINLTGADTVIFYDSDWNPAMDQQAQDRCHRIGQTREVHIYRLISEGTIEESILQKAIQKRQLDNMAIQLGNFDTSTVPAISTVPAVLDDDVESFPLRSQRCKLEKESTDIRNDIPEPLQTSTHPFEPTALSKVEKYALSICRQYTDISDGDNVT